ncbi:hypothetical protein PVT67_11930 [Gallaecimonas kandeliae]|uniref:hypothetical protein n=1 Tax=Gallaecimonas kandeliae TaxID=3029055 RepID=UPI0026484BEF|nr:hypothetical protein [Gallaecimonas kandeliae]WKE64383.1 hypothetical protein PVT67_11930 [Gallaecimonas kandeliae]
MSLDIAYSIEAEDYLDPDRAYDLYWAGIISDKKMFLCPGTDCSAQVTCANLDEDLQDMKVVPHYRVYGKHNECCEVFNQIPLNLHYENGLSEKEERRSIDESVVDVFLLERPDSYYDEPKQTNEGAQKAIIKSDSTKSIKKKTLRENGSIGNIYSVRTVVSRYIRYRKEGSLDLRRVNIQGKDVQYKSIFKCIWEQDLSYLPDHPVIYYGWAFVNRLPSGQGYQIKFKKKFKKESDDFTSTIMISDRLIESYKIKKLVSTRLQKIFTSEKPTAFVFIYGKPEQKESKSGNRYANFSISNLDMIDINYDCPLPKEYNK